MAQGARVHSLISMGRLLRDVCAASAESGTTHARGGTLCLRCRPAEEALETGHATSLASLGRPAVKEAFVFGLRGALIIFSWLPGVTKVTDQSDPGVADVGVRKAREKARDFIKHETRRGKSKEVQRGSQRTQSGFSVFFAARAPTSLCFCAGGTLKQRTAI